MKTALTSRFSIWIMARAAAMLASSYVRGKAAPQFARARLPSPSQAGARVISEPTDSPSTEATELGRTASAPSQIPARGWKETFIRVWRGISQHRILAIAAGVTFYALLAVFPAVAALVAIYSLFADPSTIRSHIESLSAVLPSGATSVIGDQINRLAAQGRTSLGVATFIGLAISLWSANAGMKAVFDSMNIVYQEDEKRGVFKLNAISLGFTLGAILLAVIGMATVVALPPVLSQMGLPAQSQDWINLLRWPLLLLFVSLAASVIYRYGPSRNEAMWRWLSPGAVLFTVGWLVASLLFSWYTANFGSYNKTYGSLGAAVGFMYWIWITNIALLIGAELNAELELQTAKDTTRGDPKPMGERGAAVADGTASA